LISLYLLYLVYCAKMSSSTSTSSNHTSISSSSSSSSPAYHIHPFNILSAQQHKLSAQILYGIDDHAIFAHVHASENQLIHTHAVECILICHGIFTHQNWGFLPLLRQTLFEHFIATNSKSSPSSSLSQDISQAPSHSIDSSPTIPASASSSVSSSNKGLKCIVSFDFTGMGKSEVSVLSI
jgi:hypothetical protein